MRKENRIVQEQKVVETMIRMYCRRHSCGPELCGQCTGLLEYARDRIARCPFGQGKPFCSHCTVHCYRSAQRDQIRRVMRYAGPRMLLVHPGMAIRHMVSSWKAGPSGAGGCKGDCNEE